MISFDGSMRLTCGKSKSSKKNKNKSKKGDK